MRWLIILLILPLVIVIIIVKTVFKFVIISEKDVRNIPLKIKHWFKTR